MEVESLPDDWERDKRFCGIRQPAADHFSDHVCCIPADEEGHWYDNPHFCGRCRKEFNYE